MKSDKETINNLNKNIKSNVSRNKIYIKPYNTRESNKYIKFNINDDNLIETDSDDNDYNEDEDNDENNECDEYEDTYKDIKKYIDNHIKIKNDKNKIDEKTQTLIKTQTYTFYENLIHYQPKLNLDTIKYHIDFFLDYDIEQQTKLVISFTELLDLKLIKTPHLFKIMNSTLDLYYKKIALNKLQLLEQMTPDNNEYFKLKQWIDTLLDIPFNIYKTPHYLNNEKIKNSATYLKDSKEYMDTIIYGQHNTKAHIIEILAKMISNPKTLGSVFAIHGEAGTGKTTLIKDGLSIIFGLPFIFISLGGAQDRAFLAGSNYVYEGSACGKIIQSLKQSQCMNPIFYFDELDKVSNTDKGQEIINLLVHLTDYSQNSHFNDDYMDGISLDLSRATFIFSFNDKEKISPILLDRMEMIKFNSYTKTEKKYIAKHFLLPSVVKNVFGEKTDKKIELLEEQLDKIIVKPNIYRDIYNIPIYNNKNYTNQKQYNKKQYNKNHTNKNNIKNPQHKIIHKLIEKKKKKNKNKNKININYNNNYGGVRYIKKRIEKILARMNVDIIMGTLKLKDNNIIPIDNKYIDNNV
jgi:ATP-dependent Lon protease